MPPADTAPAAALGNELSEQRRTVSFDVYDLAVKQLVDFVGDGTIDIAPDYQRQFVWGPERQSQFVESVFIGIPIPSLFMATNTDSTWEVIDGVQRLSTLIHFCGDDKQRQKLRLRSGLALEGLEKLCHFNGYTFSGLPQSLRTAFHLRPIRITVLNDKSDMKVRFDLFERLNAGGVLLQPQEIWNCVYRGPFNDLLKELADSDSLRTVLRIKKGSENNGTREEMVLRFFAYLDRYKKFEHSVKDFLNDYMQDMNYHKSLSYHREIFTKSFRFLASELPDGVVRGGRTSVTPVNLFEAITVGTALVLRGGDQPKRRVLKSLLDDEGLRSLTTGATNSRKMVAGRIQFVANRLS
jgi:hypothetical protein